ncbi:MAG: cytochrome c peroxidase [Planctomycetota bacterium]
MALLTLAVITAAPLQGPPRLPLDSLPAELSASLPHGLDGAPPAASEGEISLGRKLFFDPLLSIDRSVACASCHDPKQGFASSERFSLGVGGQRTLRNSPTLFNRGLGSRHMWDGRVASLEEQALVPIADPREMGLGVEAALQRLNASSDYRARFESVFGSPPDAKNLGRSIASFVGRLYLADSPVDRFRIDNDFGALSSPERSGLWLFESRGQCWRCHSGSNFSDELFHNTGVGAQDGVAEEGRLAITHEASDRGRFKTPTLRGLALTAPYMHDGSKATLEEVVAYYREGGIKNPDLAPELAPIEMSDDDARNLVHFLRALSRQAAAR